jgi:hypothetical protein
MMDCGDQGDSYYCTWHQRRHWLECQAHGFKMPFLFSFEIFDRNRHFGGNLSAHILVKSKYVLSAWLKDSKWGFIVLSITSKIIKDVWFLGPMNLMRNHAWTRYKCSILNIILILFSSGSVRVGRKRSMVEAFAV